jgi:hypothetical protein
MAPVLVTVIRVEIVLLLISECNRDVTPTMLMGCGMIRRPPPSVALPLAGLLRT